jgi:hypothetical protein
MLKNKDEVMKASAARVADWADITVEFEGSPDADTAEGLVSRLLIEEAGGGRVLVRPKE